MDEIPRAIVDVETVSAKDAVVVGKNICDVDSVQNVNVELFTALHQAALDFQPRVVARKCCTPEGMCSEESLGDATVVLPGKTNTVACKIGNSFGCALGHDFRGWWVGSVVTRFHVVGGMLLPAVFGVHGAKGRVNPAGCQRGVGIMPWTFAKGYDVDPTFS